MCVVRCARNERLYLPQAKESGLLSLGSRHVKPGLLLQESCQPATVCHQQSEPYVTRVNELLFKLQLDNVNMFNLVRWVRENKIAFKVRICCQGTADEAATMCNVHADSKGR